MVINVSEGDWKTNEENVKCVLKVTVIEEGDVSGYQWNDKNMMHVCMYVWYRWVLCGMRRTLYKNNCTYVVSGCYSGWKVSWH